MKGDLDAVDGDRPALLKGLGGAAR